MKKLGLLIVLATITVFQSCTSNKIENFSEESKFKLVDSICIDPNFGVSSVSAFELDGQEYFSVANFKTQKEIRIFHQDSLVRTISLNGFSIFKETPLAYEVLNLDTILIILNQDPRIFYVDAKGVIFKAISFEDEYNELGGMRVRRDISPAFLNRKEDYAALNFLTAPDFTGFTLDSLQKFEEENRNNLRKQKKIVVKGLSDDTSVIETNLSNAFEGMLSDNQVLNSAWYFTLTNDKYCATLESSNKINVFNSDFELEKQLEVKSDFVDIGYKLPEVKDLENYMDIFKSNVTGKRMISYVLIDEETGDYIVFLNNIYEKEEGTSETPDLIVYSKDWVKLGEYKKGDHSFGGGVYYAKNKYYIKRLHSNCYDVFEYN
ncbi:hypothetical protein SAMN05216474_0901 [Lishizhenia tianjinensis]|uniref:TolB-like 6-blade propeller-like n=1 Tax=Lishizhenia tianjinensis TaxID=477690 RepID=A0A1I6YHR0_9FLAO|nr:hypothetical protein [Lishizhenia tianjinensis]SFT49871.1 hypothetical protein SAMN05216474_0901 [Lishizhenia tianjinensis]